MKDKEKQIQTLALKLHQLAEDLLDPMLDNQTTVLIIEMGKVRKKIEELLKK